MNNPDHTSQMISETAKQLENNTRYRSDSTDAFSMIRKWAMEDLHLESDEENNIYDADLEKEIEERLSKLDELSRNEFYRLRTNRKEDGVLSDKELDILTLEAMERSYNYRKDK